MIQRLLLGPRQATYRGRAEVAQPGQSSSFVRGLARVRISPSAFLNTDKETSEEDS